MAKSKAQKRKKAQATQKRQAHTSARAHERDHEHAHLPKTGTAEDDAYLLRRSREDVVDFGLTEGKRGWATWIMVGLALLAVVALVAVLIVR